MNKPVFYTTDGINKYQATVIWVLGTKIELLDSTVSEVIQSLNLLIKQSKREANQWVSNQMVDRHITSEYENRFYIEYNGKKLPVDHIGIKTNNGWFEVESVGSESWVIRSNLFKRGIWIKNLHIALRRIKSLYAKDTLLQRKPNGCY